MKVQKNLKTENTTRESRMLRFMSPHRLDLYREDEAIWYESPLESRKADERHRRREQRLAWVRAVMLLHLTQRECQCVTMHYLDSMTFRAIGKELGINASNAQRNCRKGIHKLQAEALKKYSTRA